MSTEVETAHAIAKALGFVAFLIAVGLGFLSAMIWRMESKYPYLVKDADNDGEWRFTMPEKIR
jgi:hypothetical protein